MSPMIRMMPTVLILALAAAPASAQDAAGGPLSRLIGRFRHNHGETASYPTPAATQAPAAAQACGCEPGSDPYGFSAVLNRIRASAGLHPLSYDPELSSWASQNNSEQCRRGLGHHVNPCGVQNCGWNYTDANAVAQGWMNSPGHRRNMLAPNVSRFGIAFGPGPYWTLNAR